MGSVALIFAYMFVTAYIMGFLALSVIRRLAGRGVRDRAENKIGGGAGCEGGCRADVRRFWRIDAYVMAGLVTVTVYAQIFSLFGGVGALANGLLLAGCLAAGLYLRKEITAHWKMLFSGKLFLRLTWFLFLFLLFSYGTSRGMIHYDSDLYHAQSIRWIEEYGVVRGLGNLHGRLAYNSSAFSLSALYSFAFLGGQSFHCAAGFFALLLAKVCGELAACAVRGRWRLGDFVRVMGIYYLFTIYDEIVSPASDYFCVLTVFYIIIRWLDLLEEKRRDYLPYALLCLAGVFTMTVKLSAALILLLAIWPAVLCIRERRWRAVCVFCGAGLLILAPYLIRNVLISGWLLYPSTVPDLFKVDWKIPVGRAEYDYREIQVWGRGYRDVTKYNIPVTSWLPQWFAAQTAVNRLFIAAGIGTSTVLPLTALYALRKRKKDWIGWLLMAFTVDASFFFWLLSAPLMRYGCVYVWLAPCITYGALFIALSGKRKGPQVLCSVMLGLLACYKLAAFGREVTEAYTNDYWALQKDYQTYETQAYSIGGITFYYPTHGDQTGYDAFPSSPSKADIRLRGSTIQEGFAAGAEDGAL